MTAPITILIADDHQVLREGLRAVLQGIDGIEVVGAAEDGHDAVRLARQLEPDLVIMDVAMPGMNGMEATRRIVHPDARTRVLALSMHSDSSYVKGMLRAGASGYMLKDCAAEELAMAIRTVVSNQMYVSPGIEGAALRDCVSPGDG